MNYRQYIANRFYLRGLTPLGILNTVTGFLFNRVLVRGIDSSTNAVAWWWDKATNHPPGE